MLTGFVFRFTTEGTTIHTDECASYYGLKRNYNHESVSRSKDEYSRNGVRTNRVESVFPLLRRPGLHGSYHHASEKHMAATSMNSRGV
jgi:ISXO2-like transposase domain